MKKIAAIITMAMILSLFSGCALLRKGFPGLPDTGLGASGETDGSLVASSDASAPSDENSVSACAHEFGDATCTVPAACKKCGVYQGEALGHDYKNDKCTRCGAEGTAYVFGFPCYVSHEQAVGGLAVLREDGRLDPQFIISTTYYLLRDEQYYHKVSEMEGYYQIPEDVYIAGLRKYFVLPDDQIASLKAASPYFYGLVEYRDGYFYDNNIPFGFEMMDYVHVTKAYSDDGTGTLTVYVDHQKYQFDENTGTGVGAHDSYYAMQFVYAGKSQILVRSQEYEDVIVTYDEGLADSIRLQAVFAVDSIPANALPVE